MSTAGGAVASRSLSALLKSKDVRWAAGGWIFFVAENAILSENRTYLISELGDDNYHLVYGTLSTIATASIGYSFYRLRSMGIPAAAYNIPRSPVALGASWVLLTVGLNMATQALPKFQIPVGMSSSDSGASKLQVRCPFDFKEPARTDDALHGLERVTRHPGLWSLGLTGLGHGILVAPAALPLKLWFTGPALVAWLGGAHTDSRFRRNMGGSLSPAHDAVTSNIPFMAMATGRQGNVLESLKKLGDELKPLNAGLATAASTIWVVLQARRFRLR